MLAATELGRDTKCCADFAHRAKSRMAACVEMAWVEPVRPSEKESAENHFQKEECGNLRDGGHRSQQSDSDIKGEDTAA
jgi:hypothetical protein